MAPLRSLGNPDISPFDDVFAATGKRYNHYYDPPSAFGWTGGRGVFSGGANAGNSIHYITIQSTGCL